MRTKQIKRIVMLRRGFLWCLYSIITEESKRKANKRMHVKCTHNHVHNGSKCNYYSYSVKSIVQGVYCST